MRRISRVPKNRFPQMERRVLSSPGPLILVVPPRMSRPVSPPVALREAVLRHTVSFFLLALALAAPSAAQEEPARGPYRAYEPASRAFRCDIPSKGWQPLEEETAQGYSVHILGPEDPAGIYRTGIDVHFFEPGQPGFVPVKQALDLMRREDKASGRRATSIRVLRNNGVLSRLFEITETRRLPVESLPSAPTALHHYVALIQSGESYFVLRLSSTREVYLDYREEFLRFLKNFRPLGYK